MIGSRTLSLVVLSSIGAGALVGLTPSTASALDNVPWTGTITYSQTVSGGSGSVPGSTCDTGSGSASTTTNVRMDWHSQVNITGISFTTANLGNSDALLYAPVDESLGYTDANTFSNPSCMPSTQIASGSFSGVANSGGVHNSVSVDVGLTRDAQNDLQINTGSVLITGTSQQTGFPGNPPPTDTAKWGAGTDTIIVPTTSNTFSKTFTTLGIDNSLTGAFGDTPQSANVTTANTVTVDLTHGTAAAPNPPKAPTTKITKSPAKKTTTKTARFTFTSTTKGATFRCSLDGKKATTCKSPKTYKKLKVGKHKFSVYAVDPTTKLVDKSPAKKTWTVKKKPTKH